MNFLLSLLACTTCANSFKHAGANAAGWSIAVMLMIIVPIACAVVFFIVRIARREKAGLDPRYMDDYVAPPNN